MICQICGKNSNEGDLYCTYCGGRINTSESSSYTRKLSEADMGFSRPDSEYIKPEVIRQPDDMNGVGNAAELYANNIEETDKIRNPGSEAKPAADKAGLPDTNDVKPVLNKKYPLKKIFIPAAIVLIIIFVFLIGRISDKKIIINDISAESFEIYNDYPRDAVVVYNRHGKKLIEPEHCYFTDCNPDKTAIAVAGTCIQNNKSVDCIYYIDAHNVITIYQNVKNLCISDNGKFLLYSYEEEINETKQEYLFLYDADKKSSRLIMMAENKWFGSLCISPCGNTLSYTLYSRTGDESNQTEAETFLVQDRSRPVSAGKDIEIIAISDNTRYIYYIERRINFSNSMSLYLLNDNKRILLSDDFTQGLVCFNKDYSEIMFSNAGKTYICIKGNEKQAVGKEIISSIAMPSDCLKKELGYNSFLYDMKSFQNSVAVCEDNSLRFIDKNYKFKKIDDTLNQYSVVKVSEDGNNLLYNNSRMELIKVSDLKGKCRQKTIVEKINSFTASKDLSQVYYNQSGDLYYISENKDPSLIVDGSRAVNLAMSADGTGVFFQKNNANGLNEVYRSIKGGKAGKVMNIGDVLKNDDIRYGVLFRQITQDGYILFCNTDGLEVKLLAEVKKGQNEDIQGSVSDSLVD